MHRRWEEWPRAERTVGRVDWLLDEAHAIAAEDRAMCEAIGRHGAALVAEYMGVLLVVSVIIAGVAQTHIGDQIVEKMKTLIDDIAGGNSGTN